MTTYNAPQPSGSIAERAGRAASQVLESVDYNAKSGDPAPTIIANLIAAEFADLPDPTAVRELVEAIHDYFGPYPGEKFTNAQDEQIYAALSRFRVKQ